MPTLSSALDPAGYPHPKLEGAIRDFARRQPWLDAELAAWFFFEVVRRLPPDLPGEHLTFGRHERSRPGINILLGNYLLAGIYRPRKGRAGPEMVTLDATAPDSETFGTCPIPVYLSRLPLTGLERIGEWAAWRDFGEACASLAAAGSHATKRPNGWWAKVPLGSLLE